MRLAIAASALTFFFVVQAGAQVRTWVASSGLDSNPCTRLQPCRNFAAAISAVADDGEVVALDSAGYGPFTINKSVQVIAPEGVHAALAPTDAAASISIENSGFRVVLQNLVLTSQGSQVGVELTYPFGTVHISGCTFLNYQRAVSVANGGTLFLSDSVIRASQIGASIHGDPYIARFAIEGTRFEGIVGTALRLTARSEGTMNLSSLHGASGADLGIDATGTVNYQAAVVAESCMVRGFNTALAGSGNAQIHISGSTLAFNDTVWSGTVRSRGNNTVIHNSQLAVIPTFSAQ